MGGYSADVDRYKQMPYNRLGKSGLQVPALSLGLWHNFGDTEAFEASRAMVRAAFDMGITYFDLANNYGVPNGSAEEIFGRIMQKDFACYRDEMVITTKAGHRLWDGPYGIGGSKKYLVSSLEQSLRKMKLDYVDVFFSHIFDEHTPLEETLGAMDLLVRQGKALYIGVSAGYNYDRMRRVVKILERLGTPCAVHMTSYSMFSRNLEGDLQQFLIQEGIGSIAYSPLAQGLLTGKHSNGIQADSRAVRVAESLAGNIGREELAEKLMKLNQIAQRRGQSLSQLALAWVLRNSKVQSAIIGARNVEQLSENVEAIRNLSLPADEIDEIETVLTNNNVKGA